MIVIYEKGFVTQVRHDKYIFKNNFPKAVIEYLI